MSPHPILLRSLLALLALLVLLALAVPANVLASEVASAPAASTPAEVGASSETGPPATTPTQSTTSEAPVAPEVATQHVQSASPSPRAHARGKHTKASATPSTEAPGTAGEPRAKHRAPAPSALTPALPLDLRAPIGSSSSFFVESFQVPPFLLPIFQAAGTAYGIPWQVLAAINEVETDYGRDLSVSSAGAEGWMQFLPAEWAQYGVDANGDGYKDPYNPADAIFTAARYLRAAGGDSDIKAAVFSYNHSQAYVESVMLRAQLLGGTPPELLGAITGLTEAHFPVHAAARFSDGFQTLPAQGTQPAKTLVGTTIYSQAGAPVIAAQDGEIVQIGESPSLGHFVELRDAYGNTYIYAQLGAVSSVYPVLEPLLHTTPSPRIAKPEEREAAPSGPATAGAQPGSSLSEGATISSLALGAAAGLETAPTVPHRVAVVPKPRAKRAVVRVFAEGANDVYLNPLRPGVQVIAGTVLGHVGAASGVGAESAPHIFFQLKPAGLQAPLIDPKPILDGWVALENTSIFRAKGENPFIATSPTVGQVLLESKQQLEPQVLHDHGIRLSSCGRQDVQEGREDKRVLAMLEYLSVSGLKPTVAGLKCSPASAAAIAAYAPAADAGEAVDITAINGVPVAGHQGQGTLADATVHKLLMLQGVNRPQRVVSLMSYLGSLGALANPSASDAIKIAYAAPNGAAAHAASVLYSGLTPSEWTKLIARLGEIPDPVVEHGPSTAAIPDAAGETTSGGER
jgi:murein DD-endopeptidase MepM/ murein hydrolase activator NlpD